MNARARAENQSIFQSRPRAFSPATVSHAPFVAYPSAAARFVSS